MVNNKKLNKDIADSTTILRVENLSFAFDKMSYIFDNVSFTLEQGRRTALLGANGSGKSSLIHIINGLYKFDGEVEVVGIPLTRRNRKTIRRQIRTVFQNPEEQLLLPTVQENLLFYYSQLRKIELDTARRRIEKVLKFMRLEKLANRNVQELSLGEKRLVTLAENLVVPPRLLILDEPTSNLDRRNTRRLLQVLRRLKVPLLVATHDLPFARRLCDSALLVNDRKIELYNDIDQLFTNPEILRAARLI